MRAKIITGHAGGMLANGVEQCGGAVDSLTNTL